MIYTLRVMIYRLAADYIPSLRLGSPCNHQFARFIWCDNSIQQLRANYLSLYLSKCEHSPPPNHSRNERQAQLDVHFSLIWRFRLQKTSHRDVFCGATQRATLTGLITRRPRCVNLDSATKRKGNPYELPFLLNTDYNLDTSAQVVQKAVHTVTLIFLSSALLFAFLFGTFGTASILTSFIWRCFPFVSITT